MFSEAQKTAYESIKAPPELRRRVLDMAKDAPAAAPRRTRPARRWMSGAIAACLMLVATAAFLLPRDGVTVRMDGAALTEEPFALHTPMAARAAVTLTMPLTVESDGPATLQVSHGVLLAEDGSTLDAVEGGTTAVYWQITGAEPDASYTLAVHARKTTLLTLAFDEAEHCWAVTAAKE